MSKALRYGLQVGPAVDGRRLLMIVWRGSIVGAWDVPDWVPLVKIGV